MAKLSKKEVGEMCGIDPKNIAVYIGRDKLNVTDRGEIDSEDPKNKLFIEKYARKAEVKRLRKAEAKEEVPAVNGKPRQVVNVDTDGTLLLFEKLERAKLEAQVTELEERTKKLKISNEQKQGDFIKTEHAQFLITQFSENNNTTWENVLEDFVITMAAQFNLPREKMMAIKDEKVAAVNRAREKTIAATKAAMRKFQAEVAILRGRGEHE